MPVPTNLPAGHILTGSEAQAIIDELNARQNKVRGNRQTNSSGTGTTEIGVLRLDGIAITSGRLYRVACGPLVPASTVTNDVVRVTIRYSTSGSATTSSTVLNIAQSVCANTSFPPTSAISDILAPGVTGTLSIILTVVRMAGTGTVSVLGAPTDPINMWIEDIGTDPGDTGIDL